MQSLFKSTEVVVYLNWQRPWFIQVAEAVYINKFSPVWSFTWWKLRFPTVPQKISPVTTSYLSSII